MLVLTRKPGQEIVVGGVRIQPLRSKKNQIKIGIEAHPSIPIHRAELEDIHCNERPNGFWPRVLFYLSWFCLRRFRDDIVRPSLMDFAADYLYQMSLTSSRADRLLCWFGFGFQSLQLVLHCIAVGFQRGESPLFRWIPKTLGVSGFGYAIWDLLIK